MHYQQWIPWPGVGQVELSSISPIINSDYFRRLGDKKQLALSYFIFPGAVHDRRAHSMGAYTRTLSFTARMVERGFLTKQQARDVSLFALLHDIGHGPFSHLIEVFTKIDHKQNGLRILDAMKQEIKASSGNLEQIKSMMAKTNPLAHIVSDKNFGMEKLDYLIRDQANVGFGPDISRCVESVFNHLVYKDGKLMVDIKALDSAIEIQRAYVFFYRNVHLGKSSYILQRFMQKVLYQLMQLSIDQGGINEDHLWDMVDGDVFHTLKTSSHPVIQSMMALFQHGMKDFPKTAVAIRLKGHGWRERTGSKPIATKEVDQKFFDQFSAQSKPKDLSLLEAEVAKVVGIEPWKVIVSHIAEKYRFIPEDILFFDNTKEYSLRKMDPAYFQALNKEVEKYLCVRVCVAPEYREKAFAKSNQILKTATDFISRKI